MLRETCTEGLCGVCTSWNVNVFLLETLLLNSPFNTIFLRFSLNSVFGLNKPELLKDHQILEKFMLFTTKCDMFSFQIITKTFLNLPRLGFTMSFIFLFLPQGNTV